LGLVVGWPELKYDGYMIPTPYIVVAIKADGNIKQAQINHVSIENQFNV
jgi:hypothetical protein